MAYTALRAGVLFGEFQDDGPGFEVGMGAGGAIPVFRNLIADVSVFGGLVHVGTSLPRSAFGRRLVLRVGLGYALRDGAGGPRPLLRRGARSGLESKAALEMGTMLVGRRAN